MAVFSTIGNIIASDNRKDAARDAGEVSQNNNAQNNQLARDVYNQNYATINPFVNRGNAAGNQINALLGLGAYPERQSGQVGQVQPNALSQFQGNPQGYQGGVSPQNYYGLNGAGFGGPMGAGKGYGSEAGGGFGGMSWAEFQDATAGMSTGQMKAATNALRSSNGVQPSQTYGVPLQSNGGQPVQSGVQAGGQTAQQAANDAFDIFRNSTGYQFRVAEGEDALNSGFAGAGMLQSGAALRSLDDYRQGMASQEFGNYMNALGSQQAIGAGSASALAGVGQNFAGTVINSNNINSANQSNALLAQGQANANLWSGIGNSLGNTVGFAAGIL